MGTLESHSATVRVSPVVSSRTPSFGKGGVSKESPSKELLIKTVSEGSFL